MSLLYNQTNLTPGTSQYITRSEVIQGFSTLVGDLSGVNLSTLFLNPNPIVSTLTVNPNGSIAAPGYLNTQSVLFSTIGKLRPVKGFGTNYNTVGLVAPNDANYLAMYGAGFVSQSSVPDTNGDKFVYGTNFAYGIPASSGVPNPFLSWFSGNSSNAQYALQNVSSINGINPGAGMTTFTNLTGSNLTTTGTLLSPQVVGVSSLNGVIYQVPYNAGWTGGTTLTYPNATPTVVASITLPAGYLKANTTYIYDVPFTFVSFPGGQPTGMNLFIGLRLGNNGQINYQIPLYIATSSQGITLSLTGIAQTNSATVGSQTIDIVAVQNSGSAFQATITAPTSSGGLNVYTIKPLS